MFQKNISLKNYTTFKIGGRAKYFFEAKNTKEIIKAVKEAKRLKIPIFVLGGGSKILVSDKGFKGLVIKIAGINLSQLVADSIKKGLTGLEWAIGIPGIVAGAVHGNTGAFGHSISEVVKNVTVLDVNNLKIKKYNKKSCGFGYRESIFSAKGGSLPDRQAGAAGGKNPKLIILSVKLQLKKGNRRKSLELIKEYLARRRERIPTLPSIGCIFKNPKPLSAGNLIEQCGLKGETLGGAKISEKHADIIVNFNKAKAKDVFALIDLAKKQVKKKFGITLEEEIIRV